VFLSFWQKPRFSGPIGENSMRLNALPSVPAPQRSESAAISSQTNREVHFVGHRRSPSLAAQRGQEQRAPFFPFMRL